MQLNLIKKIKNGSVKDLINTQDSIRSSQLLILFMEELSDIYWAEKALTKAMPKMMKNATSGILITALEEHLSETKEHVSRIEKVFEILDKKAASKKCVAMEGLLKEADLIMDTCEDGAMRDAGIIAAGQKIEHYEIAAYGTLRQFAKTLGLFEIAVLLDKTLMEEKEADKNLSEIAMDGVNMSATFETALPRH